jgi:hypothetical protein
MWWENRRPEIVDAFEREVDGHVPLNAPKLNWEVLWTMKEANGDVPIITKKLAGHLDHSAYPSVTVDRGHNLTLRTPAHASGPVPVKMEFGWTQSSYPLWSSGFPEMNASRPGPTGR